MPHGEVMAPIPAETRHSSSTHKGERLPSLPLPHSGLQCGALGDATSAGPGCVETGVGDRSAGGEAAPDGAGAVAGSDALAVGKATVDGDASGAGDAVADGDAPARLRSIAAEIVA